jgi:hypothetical protein
MKTFKEFVEEFRYLPKAKMDRKIKDRKNSGEANSDKTQKMKLVRNVLGKNTKISVSDMKRNIENNIKMAHKRTIAGNLSGVSASKNTFNKQRDMMKTKDVNSNKKNPNKQDKLKREYELTKQDIKNRSERDTKRIINAKKRLEKSYNNSLDEKIVFDDYDDLYKIIEENIENCENLLINYK